MIYRKHGSKVKVRGIKKIQKKYEYQSVIKITEKKKSLNNSNVAQHDDVE